MSEYKRYTVRLKIHRGYPHDDHVEEYTIYSDEGMMTAVAQAAENRQGRGTIVRAEVDGE